MSVYDVNINTLTNLLLPVRLRTTKHKAWLAALASPVVYLKEHFDANRTTDLYVLAHNGQVCYLQAALNDVFDAVSRGIYIADGSYIDPDNLYLNDEDKPLFIDLVSEEGSSSIPAPDPLPLYTSAETYTLGVQFVVMVPTTVAAATGYDVHRLKALVNKYRLVGKNNYSVEIF